MSLALGALGLAQSPAVGARVRARPRRLLRRCAFAPDGPDDPERAAAWASGLPEAHALWAEAAAQATEATRRELLESLSLSFRGGEAAAAEEEADAARDALARAWTEAGASSRGADALAAACLAAGGRLATPSGCVAKLAQLRRLLPGQDCVALVQREPRALTLARPELVVANLVALSRVFAPSGVDPLALVEQHPALLWIDELDAKLVTCFACLRSWSPRSDPALVLEEFPALIESIQRYADKEFFQLPLYIQNAMAVGGGGGGTHYRSWSGDEQPDTEGNEADEDGGEDDRGGWQHADNNTD